jgi:hypothetical protein
MEIRNELQSKREMPGVPLLGVPFNKKQNANILAYHN